MLAVLFTFCITSLTGQGTSPYQVCNNKAAVSIDVRVNVSKGSLVSSWTTNIPPTSCVTVPVANFAAVGHIPGSFDCEVEVIVEATNGFFHTCPGDEPGCSSGWPTGLPCTPALCPSPPGNKCCDCFPVPGVPVNSMAWTSTQADVW